MGSLVERLTEAVSVRGIVSGAISGIFLMSVIGASRGLLPLESVARVLGWLGIGQSVPGYLAARMPKTSDGVALARDACWSIAMVSSAIASGRMRTMASNASLIAVLAATIFLQLAPEHDWLWWAFCWVLPSILVSLLCGWKVKDRDADSVAAGILDTHAFAPLALPIMVLSIWGAE